MSAYRTGSSKACRRVGTYCRIHTKCNMPECSYQAHARGICKRHDPKYKKCMEDNCNNQANLIKGFCNSHGPNWKKCKEHNCNSLARARGGRCKKHDKMYGEKKKHS